MRPNFICKGGNIILFGETSGGLATFFSPTVKSFRLGLFSLCNAYVLFMNPKGIGNNRT